MNPAVGPRVKNLFFTFYIHGRHNRLLVLVPDDTAPGQVLSICRYVYSLLNVTIDGVTDVVQQDKKTRDKAIKSLTAFLSESSTHNDGAGLPKSEMTKLWKGIFYCTPPDIVVLLMLHAHCLFRAFSLQASGCPTSLLFNKPSLQR